MGMYTQLVLNVAFKEKAPREFIDELGFMVKGEGTHDGRRKWMLTGSSHYFGNIHHCSLEYDGVSHEWKLSVTCDLKNYEREIEWFLGFIAPHVTADGFAGTYRYEKEEFPSLVWFSGGSYSLIPTGPEAA